MSEATKPAKTRKPNVGSDASKGSRVWLWQVGIYVFAIGASGILVLVNLAMILNGNLSPVVLIMAMIVIGLSWGVVVTDDDEFSNPSGLKVAASEPTVREFVDMVAQVTGAPMPDAIYLVAEAEIEIVEKTKFFGLKNDRTVLKLGLPMMHAFTQQELAALLAYELAHHADLGVDQGPRAIRGLSAARDLIAVERKGFVNAIYGSYARKIYRSVGGVGIAQELAADQRAAQAFSSQSLLSALARYDDVPVAFDQLLREYVVPALQNQMHPVAMFDGFAELLESRVRSTERCAALQRRRAKDRNEFDLHRTPTERIATLQDAGPVVAQHVFPHGGAGAHRLLDSEQKSAEIVVGVWAAALMGNRTEAKTWHELAAEVFSRKTRNIATAAFGEHGGDASTNFDQASDWSANNDWQAVDEAVAKPLKKCGDETARRLQWARCLVTDAAAESGRFAWQHNWDGPPQLVDGSGVLFDPSESASYLVAGEAPKAQASLRAALDRCVDRAQPPQQMAAG